MNTNRQITETFATQATTLVLALVVSSPVCVYARLAINHNNDLISVSGEGRTVREFASREDAEAALTAAVQAAHDLAWSQFRDSRSAAKVLIRRS